MFLRNVIHSSSPSQVPMEIAYSEDVMIWVNRRPVYRGTNAFNGRYPGYLGLMVRRGCVPAAAAGRQRDRCSGGRTGFWLGAESAPAALSRSGERLSSHQGGHDRFLDVQAVLGLVPDATLRPSMTPAVTSSPRCASRQWRKIALGAASP